MQSAVHVLYDRGEWMVRDMERINDDDDMALSSWKAFSSSFWCIKDRRELIPGDDESMMTPDRQSKIITVNL